MANNNVLNIMDVAYATVKYLRDDKQLKCTFVNKAMERLTNISRDTYLNKPIALTQGLMDDHWIYYFERVFQSEQILHFCKYDYTMKKYIEVKIFPVNKDVMTYGLIIEDMTSAYDSYVEISRLNKMNTTILKRAGTMALVVDLKTHEITNMSQDSLNFEVKYKQIKYPDTLIEAKLIKSKYKDVLLQCLHSHDKDGDCENHLIQVRKKVTDNYYWCEVIYDVIEYDVFHKPSHVLCIFRNIDDIVKQNRRLKTENIIDSLTLTYNREGLKEKLKTLYSSRNETTHGLFMIDLDNFKMINDRKGHDFGDLVLQQFAHILRMNFRKDDIIARFGGDEFCVYVHDIVKSDAVELCERLFACHGMKYLYSIGISASIGVVIAKTTDDYNDVFLQADKTMYNVKNHLKNGYQITDFSSNIEDMR